MNYHRVSTKEEKSKESWRNSFFFICLVALLLGQLGRWAQSNAGSHQSPRTRQWPLLFCFRMPNAAGSRSNVELTVRVRSRLLGRNVDDGRQQLSRWNRPRLKYQRYQRWRTAITCIASDSIVLDMIRSARYNRLVWSEQLGSMAVLWRFWFVAKIVGTLVIARIINHVICID